MGGGGGREGKEGGRKEMIKKRKTLPTYIFKVMGLFYSLPQGMLSATLLRPEEEVTL